MAGKIFINYRRGDDPGFTGRLFDRLQEAFEPERLFMDVDNIAAGLDFVRVLEEQVAQCDVLLAVIGKGWIEASDTTGARRLGSSDDFVRIEIESALKQDKRVIPVLVGEARMPRPEELPETMRPLTRRNAVRLTHERFRADAQGLIKALQQALDEIEALRQTQAEALRQAKLEEERKREEEGERTRVQARREAEQQAQPDARLARTAGLSAEQITKAEELANWEFIKTSESPQELRNHLARYPGGVTERFARARLEDLVWAELGAAPGLDQLGDFLAEFPQGTHTKAAADRRAALEREQAAAEEARERERREIEAWAAASSAGDVAAFEAFLKEWPQSQHAKAARSRVKELKRAPTRRWLLLGLGGTAGLAAVVAVTGGIWVELQPGHSLWQLLNDQSVRTFTEHSGYVTSVAFSPDGRTALSGSNDKTLKLWDVATGKELRTFTGNPDAVSSLAISPDGRTALSGSLRILKLWDLTGPVT